MSTEKRRFLPEDIIEEYQINRDKRLAQRQRGHRPVRPTPQSPKYSTEKPLEAYAKKRLEREQESHGIKPKTRRTR
jgi:hypothetical protein